MTIEHLTIITKDNGQEFLIGDSAIRTVRWSAWYQNRPDVKGYGMTEQAAIYDLVHYAQARADEDNVVA